MTRASLSGWRVGPAGLNPQSLITQLRGTSRRNPYPESRGLLLCDSAFSVSRMRRGELKSSLKRRNVTGGQMKEIRILIADDSEFVRRRVRSILSDQQSWRIVGEAAAEVDLLTKANEQMPDVVIMDIARPILGGLEAAKKILETRPEVKIVVLSIQDDGPLAWCILHAGEGGYILKPEFSRNLAATVRSACSGLLA
jgi:PleD family two-component response regulator